MLYFLAHDTFSQNVCLNTIKAWQMIGTFVYVLKILVPILLIIFAVKPLFNVIMKGTSAEATSSMKSIASKIFIAILFFMAPSLVASIISVFVDAKHPFKYCHECVSYPFSKVCSDHIKEYEKMVRDDAEKVSGSQKVSASSVSVSGGTGGDPTGKVSDFKNVNNIIIGDSRTVGMCAAMTGSYGGCSYENTPKTYKNSVFIALGSTGYSWFKSNALSYVDKVLVSNKDVKYNIFSLMGETILIQVLIT